MQGHTVQLPTKGLLEESNLILYETSSVVVSEKFSFSIAQEALLRGSSSSDEQELVAKQNCMSVLKNVALRHWQGHSKPPLGALPVDLNVVLTRGVSTLRGNNQIMPENETSLEKGIRCGISTCSPVSPPWRCFTFEEITSATNNFHSENIIGKGGYAKVYRGTLADGQVIAIKKITQSGAEEQREKEFLVEIGIMAHVSHPNTTPLLGFCLEGGLHLIFNFYPNGSLASLLHGTRLKFFEWPLRYKVAIGIARGLTYLHKYCRRRIIHRDIKASNILLDADFEPQISDFGLAKWLPTQWTHHSVTPVEGTFGYLAPEYFMHGIVDEKTDVYSFGVLLLEIISGRHPVDSTQQSLVLWARPFLESKNTHELVDPALRGSYDNHQMHCMVITAEKCVRQSSISRPVMSQVLELLTVGHNPDPSNCWKLEVSGSLDARTFWQLKDVKRESGDEGNAR